MAAATYFDQVQKLYIAFYQRPADPAGLVYWSQRIDAAGGDASAVVAAFANSDEATALYGVIDEATIGDVIDAIYLALFNRLPDAAGKQFYVDGFSAGTFTPGSIALNVLDGAQGDDAVALANKVQVSNTFTALVDGRSLSDVTFGQGTSFDATYAGDADAVAARGFLATVTSNPASVSGVAQVTEEIRSSIADADDPIAVVSGQTFTLTTGVDAVVGGAGNDTIAANPGALNAATLTSFDSIDGGAGSDTLSAVAIGAFTVPASATIKNVEAVNLIGDSTISADGSGWAGLTALNVASVGGATITAASTAAVTETDSALAAGSISVNGGSTVNVTAAKATTGTISVGATTAATGAVTVSNTSTGAVSMGTITVNGGTSVSVSQAATNAVNTTATMGSVSVTGNDSTTSVTVSNAKAATASATVAGVNANSVAITDVNTGSATKAGTITNATVSGFTTLGFAGTALASLSVANGSGNIIIDNSGLTTPTNKTLALTVNGLTGGTLDDADIYTALNVTATGANSTLANITTGAVTTVTLAGDKALTLTSTAGLTALKTVTVTGAAGISADLSGATVTAVDTTGTTGASKVTVDAGKATFTGGAGVDAVTLNATTPTKAISLGAGDDSLSLVNLAAAPTAAISGGDGTDTLTITAALAATASADSKFSGVVTGFESLTLTGATNQTIDLVVLGNFGNVTTSGGNGLTLSNLPTGGTLTLNGAGTAYTIGNSAFTAGTSDVVNLKLTDGSGAGVSFASTGITASGVETFNIAVADTQATPAGAFNDSVTLLGNSVKSIAVTGNAGLTLTSASTALTSVDASGITLGGFAWTSGALTAAATVTGSATGTNTINFSAATGGAVTYTGGTGADAITGSNGKNNVVSLGDGTNSFTGAAGNNTITGGAGADTVTVTTGNNVVNLGDGANSFSATTGNNTYVGGSGVDLVTVDSGSNTISTGAGNDVITVGASAGLTTVDVGTGTDTVILDAIQTASGFYTSVTGMGAGDVLDLSVVTGSSAAVSAQTLLGAKITLGGAASFTTYLNAASAGDGNTANTVLSWFQFDGNTYIAQDTSAAATFQDGADTVIELVGLVDLSTSTIASGVITLV